LRTQLVSLGNAFKFAVDKKAEEIIKEIEREKLLKREEKKVNELKKKIE